MKAIFLSCFMCLAVAGMGQGLHIEENHSVLFGADTLGSGVKTMWIPSKAAFRTGAVGSVSVGIYNFNGDITWDLADVGEFSMASGYASKASGVGSIALGLAPEATGFGAVAMGNQTVASAFVSTAMGSLTHASANYATALGQSTKASAVNSTAIGERTEASGTSSFATGKNTTASGAFSTTLGNGSVALGKNSVSMGYKTTARTFSEVVLGQYNTSYNSSSGMSEWLLNDRLFVIGNGIDESNPSDALVVLKNGNVGIGVPQPTAAFEVAIEGLNTGHNNTGRNIVGRFKSYKDPNNAFANCSIELDASEFGSSSILFSQEGYVNWAIGSTSGIADTERDFYINNGDDEFLLDVTGNLTISGTYNPSSDINRKHNIFSIDEDEVLDKISKLPISSWSYKEEDIRHIGPMAQDFYAAFELGKGETTIATVDADGVALAAIKALNKKFEEQERKFEEQERKFEEQGELIKDLVLKFEEEKELVKHLQEKIKNK